MNDLENKAKKIDSLLFVKYLPSFGKIDQQFIKNNIDKAVVVNRSFLMQKILKKTHQVSLKKKEYLCQHILKETKEVKNTREYHENHCFRLEFLQKIYAESHVKEKKFKKMNSFSIQKKLTKIPEFNFFHFRNIKIKEIHISKKTSCNHIQPDDE